MILLPLIFHELHMAIYLRVKHMQLRVEIHILHQASVENSTKNQVDQLLT
jgi:hypothetical protein